MQKTRNSRRGPEDDPKVSYVLKESEHFLSSIFQSIQDGISILDKNMNIIKVNHAMEKWYSHAMPLVGKKCYEAYHGRSEVCEICPTLKVLKTGKMAYEVITKHGPDKEPIGWEDLYAFPLLDVETGELKGVIEYVRDITDRKKMEKELEKRMKDLEEFYEMAVGREVKMKGLKKEIEKLKSGRSKDKNK